MSEFIQPNLIPAMPEIILLTMTCLILLIDLFLPEGKRGFTLLLSVATLVLTLVVILLVAPAGSTSSFGDAFILDRLAVILKTAVCLIMILVFIYSRDYLKDHNIFKGEYYLLGLFATLGMMIMISAHSLLMVYLGLELLSLSLYAMVALNRRSLMAAEAAMKYFVLGALASGLLLYGISMLYGMTGTLQINLMSIKLMTQAGQHPVLFSFALSFIVVGLAFKLGAVPFHMWLPDVYQGSPTAVTLLIATAPKIAGFAIMIRLLVDGLSDLQIDWSAMLAVLAVASLALGNIVAIAQTNFKRMLAYSAISHIGFVLLGIGSGAESGYASAMFYIVTYAFTAAVSLGVLILLNRKDCEAENIQDLSGLNHSNPWYAAMLAIALFSMAGIPPTAGFYAKLSILQAVIAVDALGLAIIAVLFSVVGLFYYLRVIKVMYFDATDDSRNTVIRQSLDVKILLSANSLSLLGLGIFPSLLMQYCIQAFT